MSRRSAATIAANFSYLEAEYLSDLLKKGYYLRLWELFPDKSCSEFMESFFAHKEWGQAKISAYIGELKAACVGPGNDAIIYFNEFCLPQIDMHADSEIPNFEQVAISSAARACILFWKKEDRKVTQLLERERTTNSGVFLKLIDLIRRTMTDARLMSVSIERALDVQLSKHAQENGLVLPPRQRVKPGLSKEEEAKRIALVTLASRKKTAEKAGVSQAKRKRGAGSAHGKPGERAESGSPAKRSKVKGHRAIFSKEGTPVVHAQKPSQSPIDRVNMLGGDLANLVARKEDVFKCVEYGNKCLKQENLFSAIKWFAAALRQAVASQKEGAEGGRVRDLWIDKTRIYLLTALIGTLAPANRDSARLIRQGFTLQQILRLDPELESEIEKLKLMGAQDRPESSTVYNKNVCRFIWEVFSKIELDYITHRVTAKEETFELFITILLSLARPFTFGYIDYFVWESKVGEVEAAIDRCLKVLAKIFALPSESIPNKNAGENVRDHYEKVLRNFEYMLTLKGAECRVLNGRPLGIDTTTNDDFVLIALILRDLTLIYEKSHEGDLEEAQVGYLRNALSFIVELTQKLKVGKQDVDSTNLENLRHTLKELLARILVNEALGGYKPILELYKVLVDVFKLEEREYGEFVEWDAAAKTGWQVDYSEGVGVDIAVPLSGKLKATQSPMSEGLVAIYGSSSPVAGAEIQGAAAVGGGAAAAAWDGVSARRRGKMPAKPRKDYGGKGESGRPAAAMACEFPSEYPREYTGVPWRDASTSGSAPAPLRAPPPLVPVARYGQPFSEMFFAPGMASNSNRVATQSSPPPLCPISAGVLGTGVFGQVQGGAAVPHPASVTVRQTDTARDVHSLSTTNPGHDPGPSPVAGSVNSGNEFDLWRRAGAVKTAREAAVASLSSLPN
jgi:hypothetical protein